MRSRLVKRQLIAFVVVTVVAVTVLGVDYLRIPAHLGIGRYQVSLSLTDASGLYAGAPVTFRGSEIGQVAAIDLTPDGVRARLSLEDGTAVPRGSQVQVSDGSVIGERYINLVYSSGDRTRLRAGDAIPASRVTMPTSTTKLFTKADSLLGALPNGALTSTIDQAYQALAGHQDDLTGLLDASERLTGTAASATGSTTDLLDKLQPVLATQQRLRTQIATAATGLDDVTGTLADADPTLRSILSTGPGTADRASALLADLGTDLTPMLVAMGQLGDVLATYLPAMRQILIVLPALIEANKSVQHYDAQQDYGESGLSFKINVNDPPTCDTGFPEAGKQRSPQDTSSLPLPADSYCKVAHDDPRVVRGARNFPCPNDPSRRGATAVACGLVFDPSEVSGQ